jgi:hypothetical protein
MRVEVWDSGFVRATRAQVHLLVRDPAGYQAWWPGVRSWREDAGAGLDLPAAPWRGGRHRVVLTPARDRPGKGMTFRCGGALRGECEWYYTDERTGTVVHYLLRAEVAVPGPARIVRAHRWGVRSALHALKDGLEGGRAPGVEVAPLPVGRR